MAQARRPSGTAGTYPTHTISQVPGVDRVARTHRRSPWEFQAPPTVEKVSSGSSLAASRNLNTSLTHATVSCSRRTAS